MSSNPIEQEAQLVSDILAKMGDENFHGQLSIMLKKPLNFKNREQGNKENAYVLLDGALEIVKKHPKEALYASQLNLLCSHGLLKTKTMRFGIDILAKPTPEYGKDKHNEIIIENLDLSGFDFATNKFSAYNVIFRNCTFNPAVNASFETGAENLIFAKFENCTNIDEKLVQEKRQTYVKTKSASPYAKFLVTMGFTDAPEAPKKEEKQPAKKAAPTPFHKKPAIPTPEIVREKKEKGPSAKDVTIDAENFNVELKKIGYGEYLKYADLIQNNVKFKKGGKKLSEDEFQEIFTLAYLPFIYAKDTIHKETYAIEMCVGVLKEIKCDRVAESVERHIKKLDKSLKTKDKIKDKKDAIRQKTGKNLLDVIKIYLKNSYGLVDQKLELDGLCKLIAQDLNENQGAYSNYDYKAKAEDVKKCLFEGAGLSNTADSKDDAAISIDIALSAAKIMKLDSDKFKKPDFVSYKGAMASDLPFRPAVIVNFGLSGVFALSFLIENQDKITAGEATSFLNKMRDGGFLDEKRFIALKPFEGEIKATLRTKNRGKFEDKTYTFCSFVASKAELAHKRQ